MNNRDLIDQRLEDLHSVLAYCSDLQKRGKIYVFNTFERICINQERGSLLSQLNTDNSLHDVRNYQIPPSIQAKVKITQEKIEATSWSGFTQNYFTNEAY